MIQRIPLRRIKRRNTPVQFGLLSCRRAVDRLPPYPSPQAGLTFTMASISTVESSGKAGTPTAAARMFTRIAEHRFHQVRRTICDFGLAGEVGRGGDKGAKL